MISRDDGDNDSIGIGSILGMPGTPSVRR
jgi:hypothetical protein